MSVQLVSKSDVADMLSVSARTVDRLADKGLLKRIRIGRMIRFDLHQIEAWLDASSSWAYLGLDPKTGKRIK